MAFDFGVHFVGKPTLQPAWIRIDWRDGSTTFHNLMPVFTDGKLSSTEWCARPFSCSRWVQP